MPGWQAMMVSLLHLVPSLLGWLGGAGMVVVWVLWAGSAVFIAGTAAVPSMIVVLVRKSSRSAPTSLGCLLPAQRPNARSSSAVQRALSAAGAKAASKLLAASM